MANPGYVRSTDGNDSDNGSTWALANATLAGAMSDQAAGDRIWVSDNHLESGTANVTITSPGTASNPCQILGGDDAAEPPTAMSTAPIVRTTTSGSVALQGSFYMYGINVEVGSSAPGAHLTLTFAGEASGGRRQVFESSNFKLSGNGSLADVILGSNAGLQPSLVEWRNCGLHFGNASAGISQYHPIFRWIGGSILSGGTAITTLFKAGGSPNHRYATVENVDLANLASNCNLVNVGTIGCDIVFRNCKLPASWSGALTTGTPVVNTNVEMYNCDAGDTNYKLWIERYEGTIRDETTIVRSGGASDGTTPVARKMTTRSAAVFPYHVLRSPEIGDWIESVGSSKTMTVEIIHDSTTALTDKEVWLEVYYLGTSGFPLGSLASDAAATIVATGANQTASSVTWTTTGLTNPNKQKLDVTFTPQEKGWYIARVCLAKPSYTIYFDPLPTVT